MEAGRSAPPAARILAAVSRGMASTPRRRLLRFVPCWHIPPAHRPRCSLCGGLIGADSAADGGPPPFCAANMRGRLTATTSYAAKRTPRLLGHATCMGVLLD